MPCETSRLLLIVSEQQALLKAALASLLTDWCKKKGLEVAVATRDDILDLAQYDDCRLCIANFGADVAERRSLALIRLLHATFEERPVVVIGQSERTGDIIAAFEAGASSYIPTNADPVLALRALSFVLDGGSYFPPSALKDEKSVPNPQPGPTAVGETPRRDQAPVVGASGEGDQGAPAADGGNGTGDTSLTNRQRDVLAGLRAGRSNKEIARQYGMSEATVKVHVRQVMRKLGVSNRTQAAIAANGAASALNPSNPPRRDKEPKTLRLVDMGLGRTGLMEQVGAKLLASCC